MSAAGVAADGVSDAADAYRRAIVIDDSTVDLMLYKRILRRSGRFAQIHTFSYGGEALDWLEANGDPETDVILLDINMPRMSGFEFLVSAIEWFGACFHGCVVIMLTTSLDPEDIERANSYPMVCGYLNKPLTVDIVERYIAPHRRAHWLSSSDGHQGR